MPAIYQRDSGPVVANEGASVPHEVIGDIHAAGRDPAFGKGPFGVGNYFQWHLVVADVVERARISQDGGHEARIFFDGYQHGLLPNLVGCLQC